MSTFIVLCNGYKGVYEIILLLFSHQVESDSVTPWTVVLQVSLSLTISQSLFILMSIELVVLSNHLILCYSLSFCHQSSPASGSFPMSWLFASGGQSIGLPASVLPMNIQGWFPLGLTGWIYLQSERLSRVFSSTTIRKHQFFGAQASLWSILTSLHDYWKNHSFDYMDLCWQSDVSAF